MTVDNNGLQSTTTQTITVADDVTANFGYSSMIYMNSATTFSDSSIGADTWFWDFGNGIQSSVTNPTVVFTSYGNTTVTLIASSNNICSDTIEKEIFIEYPVNTLDLVNIEDLTISPNPTQDYLQVSFDFQGYKDLEIQLINLNFVLPIVIIQNNIKSITRTKNYSISTTF